MGRRELVWRVTPHTSQEGRAFAVNVLRWMFADGVATRAHAPTRPRSLRESEATLQASSEPGAKRSRLEPRTGSTTAAGGSCKGIKGSA